MVEVSSIFAQLMSCVSHMEFEKLAKDHLAERHTRQLRMLSTIHRHDVLSPGTTAIPGPDHARHGGEPGKTPPSRGHAAAEISPLAYIKQHLLWQVYDTLFKGLFGRLRADLDHHCERKFRFNNTLLKLEPRLIAFSLSAFEWAKYSLSDGALKLHFVLGHDGCLPPPPR